MADGHAGMKDIMPEIKRGVNETMEAVDTMVKVTKSVKFASEKDLQKYARDQKVAVTKVKVCSDVFRKCCGWFEREFLMMQPCEICVSAFHVHTLHVSPRKLYCTF